MQLLAIEVMGWFGSLVTPVLAEVAASPAQSGAGSPFTDYTAGVVVYVLLTAFLVTVLIGGGILVLNLGLLSKRRSDRIGGRNPSDVSVLKNSTWPEAPYEERMFPAEDVTPDQKGTRVRERKRSA